MNKEECERAYADLVFCREVMRESIERNGEIINPVSSFDKAMVIFARLIEDHFDNPPLKFEELEVGMWVWYKPLKQWKKIYEMDHDRICFLWIEFDDGYVVDFEENMFYRKQVEE